MATGDFSYPVASGIYGRAPGYSGPGYGVGGDALYNSLRQNALSDAYGQTVGARRAAMNAGGNDPSLAAFGGLNALLSGQGAAARGVNQVGGQLGLMQRQFDYQRQMQELQWQHQQQLQEMANRAGLWGSALGLVGAGVGGFMSRPRYQSLDYGY